MRRLETQQEDASGWIAEIGDIPGMLANGATRSEAIAGAEALALRVFADGLEQREAVPDLAGSFAV